MNNDSSSEMANEIFLVTDFTIATLQVLCSTGNGFIIFLFFRFKILRNNQHLRLVFFMALTDFLLAVTAIPYISFLIHNWSPIAINYEPTFLMIASTPLPIQLKISLVLTIAIATDRNLGLYYPVLFRRINHSMYANISFLLAILTAAFDVTLEFMFSPIIPSPGCAAIGCFVSKKFRDYWGNSNLFLGIFVIVLTCTILHGLSKVASTTNQRSDRDAKRFANANRTIAGILLSSLFFVTVPSGGVGLVELLGYSIFRIVGPFYIVGILASGFCNSIIFVTLNDDARRIVKARGKVPVSSVVAITVTDYAKRRTTVLTV